MKTVCTTQRTQEWFDAKMGNVSASNMKKVLMGKDTEAHKDYALEVAWERWTGLTPEHYVSPEMQIGIDLEREARREYLIRTGRDVKLTGFVLHPTLDYFGASPDGLLLPEGGVEFKVVKPVTQRRYIRDGIVPKDYLPQVQACMLCCEQPWWDFVSYCPPDMYPEMPLKASLFIVRAYADVAMHRAMEAAATTFMGEVAALAYKLDANCPELPKVEEAADEFAGLGLDDKDLDQIWKEPK
jgi:hypothetical protein